MLMASTSASRREHPGESLGGRRRSLGGPALGPPPARLRVRSGSTKRQASRRGGATGQSPRRAAHGLRSVRVEDTPMNHRGSLVHALVTALMRPSRQGGSIASALAEGRAPLNRCAHLGNIRPSPLSCRRAQKRSPPTPRTVSRIAMDIRRQASLLVCPAGPGTRRRSRGRS
jgi:hypothetical protein